MTDNVSTTLNKAADLIEERGWTQGPGGWPDSASHDGRLCIEGGIIAALGLPSYHRVGLEACPAFMAVVAYLEMQPSPYSGHVWLYDFNDATGRTAAQVIEVLRATALIEAARERQTAEASA